MRLSPFRNLLHERSTIIMSYVDTAISIFEMAVSSLSKNQEGNAGLYVQKV
jgi:hypothetical protein